MSHHALCKAARLFGFAISVSALAGSALAGTTGRIGKFDSPTSLNDSAMFQNGPFIGLGVTTPLDNFHVQFTNTNGQNTGYAVQNMGDTATSYSGALMYDHLGALGVFQGYNNITKEYRINNVAPGGTIHFLQGANSRFYVNSAGNVGIGTTAPVAKLHSDVGPGSTAAIGQVIYGSTSGGTFVDSNGNNRERATLVVGTNWNDSNGTEADC